MPRLRHLLSRYRTLLLSRRLDDASQMQGAAKPQRAFLLDVVVGRERELAELRPGLNVIGLTRLLGTNRFSFDAPKGCAVNTRSPGIYLVLDRLKRALSAAVPEWHTCFWLLDERTSGGVQLPQLRACA